MICDYLCFFDMRDDFDMQRMVTIKKIIQERDRAKKQLEILRKSNAQVEKSMKRLCETIMKKDGSRKDEKVWFEMSMPDMIATAQESLERYYSSSGETTTNSVNLLYSKEDKEDEYKRIIAQKDAVIHRLTEELKVDGLNGEKIGKILKRGETGLKPNVNVPFIENAEFGVELSGVTVDMIADDLSDLQKLLIRVMGETGLSELNPILKKAKEAYPELKSESSLRTSMYGLIHESGEAGNRLVDTAKVPIPGNPNFRIYELSDMGKDVYSYLFGKKPEESEASLILKAYGTLEQGYGVKRTTEVIMEIPYIKDVGAKVEYMTYDKYHTVRTGPKTVYIPDIIIETKNKEGKPVKRYLEYETGKCSDSDFFAKCMKIAGISGFINIIVPNNDAKSKVIRRVEKWRDIITAEGTKFPRRNRVRIRISTYSELLDSPKNARKFPWMWERTISPQKKEPLS